MEPPKECIAARTCRAARCCTRRCWCCPQSRPSFSAGVRGKQQGSRAPPDAAPSGGGGVGGDGRRATASSCRARTLPPALHTPSWPRPRIDSCAAPARRPATRMQRRPAARSGWGSRRQTGPCPRSVPAPGGWWAAAPPPPPCASASRRALQWLNSEHMRSSGDANINGRSEARMHVRCAVEPPPAERTAAKSICCKWRCALSLWGLVLASMITAAPN